MKFKNKHSGTALRSALIALVVLGVLLAFVVPWAKRIAAEARKTANEIY